MAVRRIVLSHTNPPSAITYDNRFAEALLAMKDTAKQVLAGAAQQVVDSAQEKGDYANRTGNLRRLITSNHEHAYDNPKSFSSTEVTVMESDGKQHKRKQYHPPAGFDKTTIEERPDGIYSTVAAIMWYAAALEAKGYSVLSAAVQELITNPSQFFAVDKTDWRTKKERLASLSDSRSFD